MQFHRGWPGAGFTHSLLFGVVIGLILWKGFGSKLWGLSFMLGQWAHAITDTGDTVGTMLLFPWTHHFTIGAWAYAGQTGRLTDAAAYFSGLGGMWDLVWILYGLYSWRVLTTEYFTKIIYKADHRFWGWLHRYIGLTGLVTLYRAAFFYGVLQVGGVDHLGPRPSPLPLRPHLGRPALGERGSSITPICRHFRRLTSCCSP